MLHRPIPEQGLYLRRVVNGFHNYYAVPTNFSAINSFPGASCATGSAAFAGGASGTG